MSHCGLGHVRTQHVHRRMSRSSAFSTQSVGNENNRNGALCNSSSKWPRTTTNGKQKILTNMEKIKASFDRSSDAPARNAIFPRNSCASIAANATPLSFIPPLCFFLRPDKCKRVKNLTWNQYDERYTHNNIATASIVSAFSLIAIVARWQRELQ